jgi:energy-coupling factor transporter transmembrane protein EcfT
MMTVLVLCTPWNRLLRALRMLRVPAEIVTMLTMTHRYLFLLIETAKQMFEARQSRTVGHLSGQQQRKLMTSAAGVLLSKSVDLSEEITGMISRGFRGEIYCSEHRYDRSTILRWPGFSPWVCRQFGWEGNDAACF